MSKGQGWPQRGRKGQGGMPSSFFSWAAALRKGQLLPLVRRGSPLVRINKLTILLTQRPSFVVFFSPSGEINGLSNFNYLSQCPPVLDQTASSGQTFLCPGWEVHQTPGSFIPLLQPLVPFSKVPPPLSTAPRSTCSVGLTPFNHLLKVGGFL